MRNAAYRLVLLGAVLLLPGAAAAQGSPPATDGQADFDWEIGEWRTELRLLLHPMTDSARWTTFEGTSVVRKVWDGAANLVELRVEGPSGRIEGLSLRLFDPHAGQWSLHYANRRTGRMTEPAVGRFSDGRGLFIGQATLGDGRPVHVRFEISQVSPDSWRFEQAFSDDGGRTWEVNWIAVDTRTAAGVHR